MSGFITPPIRRVDYYCGICKEYFSIERLEERIIHTSDGSFMALVHSGPGHEVVMDKDLYFLKPYHVPNEIEFITEYCENQIAKDQRVIGHLWLKYFGECI